MKKQVLIYSLTLLSSITLLSCSKSPESAIDGMKKKTDEYLLKGIKPSVDMIVSDCSDLFDNNYKNDVKWISKLSVFQKELLKHINDKILFDTTKKFPETFIDGLNFDRIKTNPDSLYFYNKTHTTISNLVFINIPDYVNYKEGNGVSTELGFLELNKGTNNITVSTSGVIIDLDPKEFKDQGIVGTPYNGRPEQESNLCFYDPKTKHFLTGEQLNYCKLVYQQMKNGLTIEDIGNSLINNQQIESLDQLYSMLPNGEVLIWEMEESKKNGYQDLIVNKVTVKGEISRIYKNGYLCGVYLKGGKIEKKEDGINLTSLKKFTFQN